MNIFMVHSDPMIAAQSMVDRHVVKMILESAQLLSTAHRLLDGIQYTGKTATGRNVKRWRLDDTREGILYQATHINHPSAVWCRASVENYAWLYKHFSALLQEYTFRYSKIHKCAGDLAQALASPPFMNNYHMTTMPCAMAKEYIVSDDTVTNYRNYYINGKKHLHKYTKRQPPDWMPIV